MAREEIFIDEIRQPTPPEFEVINSGAQDSLINTFIEFLREQFQLHPRYPYVTRPNEFSPDLDLTKIVIYDVYPFEALFLPCITMRVDSTNVKYLQFSHNAFKTIIKYQMNSDGTIKLDPATNKPIPSHWEYTGAYESSVTFAVSAHSTIERDEIAHYLLVLFAELGRDKLYSRGFFVKGVSVGSMSEVEYRNNYIYQQNITLSIYSEWKYKIPIKGSTIRNIASYPFFQSQSFTVYDGPDNLNYGAFDDQKFIKYNIVDQNGTTIDIVPIFQMSYDGSNISIANKFGQPEIQVVSTYLYNTFWEVNQVWILMFENSGIDFNEVVSELNKEDPYLTYIKKGGELLTQARQLQYLVNTLDQGRRINSYAVVLNQNFIYDDGAVEIFTHSDPLIKKAMIFANDTVEMFRFDENNKYSLIASSIVFDSYNHPIDGVLEKKTSQRTQSLSKNSQYQNIIDGTSWSTITPSDLAIIILYGNQPIKHSYSDILDNIDKVLVDNVSENLTTKYLQLVDIRKQIIEKSNKLLLLKPLGI